MPKSNFRDPIGYYVACPGCGFKCIVVLTSEHPSRERNGRIVTIAKPFECSHCHKSFRIDNGLFVAA